MIILIYQYDHKKEPIDDYINYGFLLLIEVSNNAIEKYIKCFAK